MSASGESFRLERLSFADLPDWEKDDPRPLFPALRDCLRHIATVKPYRTGSLGVTAAELLPALEAAASASPESAGQAREFFESRFTPFVIRREGGKPGYVTAFYEPEVAVAASPCEDYRFPFYRRPEELVDLDDANRPVDLDPSYAFGRLNADGSISPYADRAAIDQGHLDGRGLEIAWARSKADVFFAHVQGAARLVYPDGSMRRITYAAKAGHPFSAIGKLLIDRGEISPSEISMQSIRAWLAAHPDEADEVYWYNRSYIFFKESDLADPDLGPIAAAKVPLVPGRSLAVDRLIHTFGFPFYIHAPGLTHLDGGRDFARLMLALDTGTAIIGPARGDIFTGWGHAAGEAAGTVRNEASFHILIPNEAAERFF
jgi:membrane-bound lytic murein transglycosylase A